MTDEKAADAVVKPELAESEAELAFEKRTLASRSRTFKPM